MDQHTGEVRSPADFEEKLMAFIRGAYILKSRVSDRVRPQALQFAPRMGKLDDERQGCATKARHADDPKQRNNQANGNVRPIPRESVRRKQGPVPQRLREVATVWHTNARAKGVA